MVKLTWQAKGRNGLTLVTDAMAALGMPPGVYRLGELEVTTDERSARLSDGSLAGSLLSQDAALRNLVEYCGCNLVDAIPALSNTPASLMNMTNKGAIRPSADADLTLVTPQGKIAQTVVAGEVLYNTI
jgi:N-acetylglucosamine-6-phosphate deacetylase